MMCTRPVVVKGMRVPCGKCLACRVARTREWTTRLLHELDYHKSSCYLTLTYNPENLPAGETLVKKDLQNFFKRLRKELGPSCLIKYYACGEYGDGNDRPHYHAIVFGFQSELSDLVCVGRKNERLIYSSRFVSKLWPLGFNSEGAVESDSIQYVVGYVRKKLSGQLALDIYGGRVPPFALQSQGLGKRWIDDNICSVIDNDLSVTHNGVVVGLPRYYRKRHPELDEPFVEKAMEKEEEFYENYERVAGDKWYGIGQQRIRAQREKDLESIHGRFSDRNIKPSVPVKKDLYQAVIDRWNKAYYDKKDSV